MYSSRLNAEFLLGFLESYPAAVCVFELDGTFIFINERACDLLQKSRTELMGKHVQDIVADPAVVDGFIARIMLKRYVDGEVRVTLSDSNTIGVRLTGVLVKDSIGKPLGIVGMARGTNDTASRQTDKMASAVQRVLNQLPNANMLTVAEVASELRVSKETVRRWVRNRQLSCIKLPRGIRIPSEVIKDLIRTHLQMEGRIGNSTAGGGGLREDNG